MSDASELFALLAAAPRRRTLFLLCERDPVSLPEGLLSRETAGAEADQPAGESSSQSAVTASDPDRLEAVLVHSHLPKLEDAGLVEWDREAGTASRGPSFGEVEPALRSLLGQAAAFPDGLR